MVTAISATAESSLVSIGIGILQRIDPDALFTQVVHDVETFAQVTAEPVESDGDDGVAGARVAQQLGDARAVEDGPGLLVRVDLLGGDAALAQATSTEEAEGRQPRDNRHYGGYLGRYDSVVSAERPARPPNLVGGCECSVKECSHEEDRNHSSPLR